MVHNNSFYLAIDEDRKHLLDPRILKKNTVIDYTLQDSSFSGAMRNFSIKFVYDGTAYYKVKKQEYKISNKPNWKTF